MEKQRNSGRSTIHIKACRLEQRDVRFQQMSALFVGLVLIVLACLSAVAQAAVINFDTLNVAAVGGKANESGGTFPGGCTVSRCFQQDGAVVGVVNDPLDVTAHFHRGGLAPDYEAQYHPDSTGIYLRMADLSSFSLQNVWLDTRNATTTGGNFVLYGYANALNDGLLTDNLGVDYPDGKLNPLDPEGGTIAPIASYRFANDGVFARNVSLPELLASDPDWGKVSAVWITTEGFNHSPAASYAEGTYAEWDVRVDDIVLAAPVPLPGALWLLASGVMSLGLGRSTRRKL